jgi:hypothetical protein
MEKSLSTHQTVPKTVRLESKALKPQTSSEGVWNLLGPAQREAVFQTIVQVCHQLMHCHRGDEKERENE